MILRKIKMGLLFGVIAGIIDVTPMVLMKLSWDADLSAFSMWIVIGFLVATSNLKMPSILKGILISFLVLLPIAIIIGSRNLADLIPVCLMTLILGSFIGYGVGCFEEN
jgi:hypothetical protein